jgi:hypothetical protein
MPPTADDGHRLAVAVVRVEVRDGTPGGLLIELLEVGRERRRDRFLGRAANAADACRVLEAWLREVSARAGPEAPGHPEDDEVTGQ